MSARAPLRWTRVLPALLAIHVVMWVASVLVSGISAAPRQFAGEFLSSFALIVVSTNLMLVTRARPLERAFGGLDKLFVSHRMDGIIAATVIVGHFSVIPKSVGFVWSKPVGYTTISLILLAVVVAAAPRSPWRRLVPLKYQYWKFSHRFMGLLVASAATHSLLTPPNVVRTVPALTIYVYGIVTVGLCAWVYREVLFPFLGPIRPYKVAATRRLRGDDVLEVSLDPVEAPLERTAGQFAFVTFRHGPSREQHPFTVSLPPGPGLRFSIKASGDYTRALPSHLPEGSAARVEGPYGAFDFRRGRPRQLWLAGGIGITPFLSMAAEVDESFEVTLVWSVRTPDEAIYAQELQALAAEGRGPMTVIHPTASRGHLRLAELTLGAPLAEHSVFICGPVAMRKAFLKQLAEAGVPRDEIYFEEFRLR